MVTGLDLVELQLRIAAGEPLPMKQEDVTFAGHAIEFRINAEDPWDNFKPSSGRLRVRSRGADRFDSGYDHEWRDVPGIYDSLVAKKLVSSRDRATTIDDCDDEIRRWISMGVRVNQRLLEAILDHDDFRLGGVTTGWLEEHLDELLASGRTPAEWWVIAAALVCTMSGDRWPWATTASYERLRWLGPGLASVWLDDGIDGERLDVTVGHDGRGTARFRGTEYTFAVHYGYVDVGGVVGGGNVNSLLPGLVQVLPGESRRCWAPVL